MIIWVDSIFAEKIFSQSPLIVRQIMCIKDKLYFLGTNLGRVYTVLVSNYLYLFPVLLSKKAGYSLYRPNNSISATFLIIITE